MQLYSFTSPTRIFLGLLFAALVLAGCRGQGMVSTGVNSNETLSFAVNAQTPPGVHKYSETVLFEKEALATQQYFEGGNDIEGFEFTPEDLTQAEEVGGYLSFERASDGTPLWLNDYIGRVQLILQPNFGREVVLAQFVPPFDERVSQIAIPVVNRDLTESLRGNDAFTLIVDVELLQTPNFDCHIVLNNIISASYSKEYAFKVRKGRKIID